MFLDYDVLRGRLRQMIQEKTEQGADTRELSARLDDCPDDLEAMQALSTAISLQRPSADWPYVEPSAWADIERELAPLGATPALLPDIEGRARRGFLGAVTGCVLGKPVEVMPTMRDLREALSRLGDWPLNDYISERISTEGGLGALHPDAPLSVREAIDSVPPDDDINYMILGMLLLEKHGLQFRQDELARLWLENIPLGFTWGPERTFLTKLGLARGLDDDPEIDFEHLADLHNPGGELCGAMIRAHAYGYAAPGNPKLASRLAFRDASLTHRGNGVYGSMFVAAAISLAFTDIEPLDIARLALTQVPQRSRFFAIGSESVEIVRSASDWESAYEQIHHRFREYGHCRVMQELGTLINSLHFATSVGHGVCLQVSQGNDTDSFGAIAGAILGVHFDETGLEPRWLAPFSDTIRTRVAGFHELSLNATAERMARLTRLSLM